MHIVYDLAIIMPTRNRPEVLARSLSMIRARGFEGTPIYVFDDASEDAAAVRHATASVPGVTLIRSDVQLGPAGGRNRLLQTAQAKWCLAIDDDCYPQEHINLARWLGTSPKLGDPIIVGFRYFRPYDGDISPPGTVATGPSRFFHGGASLLHRESVLSIGGYRDFLIFGAEDSELACRVWASNYQVWIDPDNFVIHEHVSAGRNPQAEAYYYIRNRIIMNVLTLPLWLGLPLGLVQAMRRAIFHRDPITAMRAIVAGCTCSIQYFSQRRPLTFAKWRWLRQLQT